MSSDLGWEFPIDSGDQWQGFNDPGIEHFRGSPFGNLAREIIQNSLDAAVGNAPVSVSFDVQEIPTEQIPGIEDLKDTVKRCLGAPGNDGKKAQQFFYAAAKALLGKKVTVLSIVEKNTTGIRGPYRNDTPYFAYMKSTGQSKKEVRDGGVGLGSYGIGKLAPFAVSDVRTIFVSTVFKSGATYKQFTQGKALLTSHLDQKNRTRQNVGFWGVKANCMPVDGRFSELPKWVQRARNLSDLSQNLGTSFHVIGFNAVQDWDKFLLASVLENFFSAIWKSQLVVKIGNEVVAKETINELFARADLVESLTEMSEGEPEAFNNAKHFLETLVGTEEVIIENQENRELGNCEVRIVVGDVLPKRVAILRNGMFITDQMEHLKRFGDFKEFVAVVECQNNRGNELLREMEPPRHDKFEPDRLTLAERPRGQRALSELGRWVRDMLKRHARDPVSDVTEVKELADYFADDFGEDNSSQKGEEVNPVGAIKIRAQPLRRRAVVIQQEGEGEEGGAGGNGGSGGGGGGHGPKEGAGSGGNGKSSPVVVELSNVRSVVLNSKKRRVAFTLGFTGKMELLVYEAGADTDRRLDIVKCSAGKVRNGAVKNIPVKRGIRTALDIELNGNFEGAMKVTGHEI
jgi:hypothetical protein